jgi:hypothetical protein
LYRIKIEVFICRRNRGSSSPDLAVLDGQKISGRLASSDSIGERIAMILLEGSMYEDEVPRDTLS